MLRDVGVVGADIDARILLGAACGLDHAGLIRESERRLGVVAGERLETMMQRRLAHEPVSRIVGQREFWGLTLTIGPDVLDPRPETEGVVTAVLDSLKGREHQALRLLDLGTGSGAILAALLHELPGAYGVGVERSAAACRTAANNLRALGLASRAGLIRGSWTDALAARFDAVVCNPPYIPTGVIADLAPDVRDYDPPAALDGGADGLADYRALLPEMPRLLKHGGVAALECGWDQAGAVAGLFRSSGLPEAVINYDLAGLGRVVVARMPT